MGESAKINSDMFELMKIRNFDYGYMQSKILDMSPAQYKSYNEICKTKDLTVLDSIMKTNTISAKAYQVMNMHFEYESASNKMFYDYYWESAYREKNKIPRTQRTIPIKSDSLTAEYFDFINNESVNNPLAVVSPSYNSYINRLKYLEILQATNSFIWNPIKIATDLQKSGYTLTDSEKVLVEKIKGLDAIQNAAEEKSYNEKYAKPTTNFFTKHQEIIAKLYKENPKADFTTFGAYFKENKLNLTADEESLMKAIIDHAQSEAAIKISAWHKANGDSLNTFYKRHNDFVMEQFAQARSTSRDETLKKIFNVKSGLGRDIMVAQDYCRNIVEEISPVSDIKLKAIQQQFSTPFVAEYVSLCNNQSIAKLEANKKKTGFVVNETPKTEADKIFEAIISKYKGKVIYVDFWATWCGPCRSGIEQIKPLKEELVGKDIVFVYITNPTSPQSTWSNMIPDIKGEHYRVTTDEWNFLTSKFNISGIPHYVLVGKTGEIINPNFGHYDIGNLMSKLEKYINE
jgi:thiol-disulfide isomerase/thioredoxin